MFACYCPDYFSVAVVELLLSFGADTTIVNKDGITALMLAQSQGFDEKAQLLLKETC
jgi:ankyrin repeat protein